MNKKLSMMLVLLLGLTAAGCGSGILSEPTLTPTLTVTSTPTLTPVPTRTPTPTPTPVPISASYVPVPRWMILAQPGNSVEILGEKWNYANDGWGESYACIDYTRENPPHKFFEQCFALIEGTLTFESQLDAFLKEEFEILSPQSSFDDIGQLSLVAKRLEENGQTFIKFFEMVGTEKYLLLVEMNVVTDDESPLQTLYEEEAADIIDFVLQSGLQKSRILPPATATPLSPEQQDFYPSLAKKLITDIEASGLYDGTWEALGDGVSEQRVQVCRNFEDRTNADMLWVRFRNCVYSIDQEFEFETIADIYTQEGDVVLESRHQYDDRFALYGYSSGHTYFDAWLIDGEFVYMVSLESRALVGQTINDVFSEAIDDFLHDVLMKNMEK